MQKLIRMVINSLADGTADDYVALNTSLIFTPGTVRMCTNIGIADDLIYEDPENFIVTLDSVDPSVDVDPMRQTGTATISDDDGKHAESLCVIIKSNLPYPDS